MTLRELLSSRLVVAALAVALAFRLVPAIALESEPGRFDSVDYHRHAVSIADGDGYPEHRGGTPTALRPPLYPFALGAVYAVAGDSPRAARIAQAFLGVAAVALVGLIAGTIWGPRAGAFATLLAAVYPPLAFLSSFLIAEPLFLVLELGAILAVLRLRASERPLRWALAAGGLAGLAALTRGNGAALLIPLVLGAWGARPWLAWRAVAAPAALVAAAALVVAPWTVRNAVVLDAFVPVSTQAGFNLAGTFNDTTREDPEHPGFWRVPWNVPEHRPLFDDLFAGRPWDERAVERELRSRALDYARENPAYLAELAGRNTVRLVHLSGESADFLGSEEYRFGTANAIAVWIVGLLAIAAVVAGRARGAPPWLWITPVLMWLSVIVISGQERFRAPIDPFLVMLAALALASLPIARRRGATRAS